MRLLLPCAIVGLVLLAGCSSTTTTSSSTGAAAKFSTANFDGSATGGVPAGWSPTGGSWRVVSAADAPSGTHAMEGRGDATEGRTTLVADGAGALGDFEAFVRFNLQSGEHPQGAGLSFRFVDETHYYCIRYSNSEQGWHLFLANGADPSKKPDATVEFNGTLPGFNEWVSLRVEADGSHIEAFANGTKVIDYTETDATAPKSGKVGLMLRGQTVALFDDFEVETI
ncbi:MAG: hypothetical protein QOD77_463 [Thermoplasmata archaeon]|jgi:hypothetical protein|nr:hypothetical protein [Thermoplasmata archaeon]